MAILHAVPDESWGFVVPGRAWLVAGPGRPGISFLAYHPDQAFTQGAIAEATGGKQGPVGPALVRLLEDGRVGHRGTYWRISDHERRLDGAVGHTATVAASDDDQSMADEEGQEYAVDP